MPNTDGRSSSFWTPPCWGHQGARGTTAAKSNQVRMIGRGRGWLAMRNSHGNGSLWQSGNGYDNPCALRCSHWIQMQFWHELIWNCESSSIRRLHLEMAIKVCDGTFVLQPEVLDGPGHFSCGSCVCERWQWFSLAAYLQVASKSHLAIGNCFWVYSLEYSNGSLPAITRLFAFCLNQFP